MFVLGLHFLGDHKHIKYNLSRRKFTSNNVEVSSIKCIRDKLKLPTY